MLKIPPGFRLLPNSIRLDSWLTPPPEPCDRVHGEMIAVLLATGSFDAWEKWKWSIETSPEAHVSPIRSLRDLHWSPRQTVECPVTFTRVKCGVCDGDGRIESGNYGDDAPRYCDTCHGNPLNLWECDAWPGLVFSMPR